MSRHDPNRPTVKDAEPLLLAFIKEARQFGNEGELHCLLEDFNLGDSFCQVTEPNRPAAKALGDMLLLMSKTQRGRIANRYNEAKSHEDRS